MSNLPCGIPIKSGLRIPLGEQISKIDPEESPIRGHNKSGLSNNWTFACPPFHFGRRGLCHFIPDVIGDLDLEIINFEL